VGGYEVCGSRRNGIRVGDEEHLIFSVHASSSAGMARSHPTKLQRAFVPFADVGIAFCLWPFEPVEPVIIQQGTENFSSTLLEAYVCVCKP
jgi:hypothetical protein